MKHSIATRLADLRALMERQGIAAAIVPQGDPHMSEYLSDHWQLRRWLSGFTGSAGDLVVTATRALLWTDSRYFLQAGEQLAGTGIELMKDGLEDTPSIASWLCSELSRGRRVGIDGMTFSAVAAEDLRMRLEADGIVLDAAFDPAAVWHDRPALPDARIFEHEVRYAGLSAADKMMQVMAGVKARRADSMFISALDEIAWILNIRANDVAYNPVVTSFLYLTDCGATLFIDPAKVDDAAAAYLRSQGVDTLPYSAVKDFLGSLPASARVLVEGGRTAASIVELLGSRAVKAASPVAMLKACKNEVQLRGVRQAMVRDGQAMVRSLCEIQTRVAAGERLTELDVADILRRHRSASPLFFDESFGTIAGYGPHGAIVHYEADADSASTLEPRGLLLIDSGAQYLDGTTDITRTIALGTPTADERRDFTLVMKGHIALGAAIFPAGTAGAQLDALARQYLWREGLSYLHGTGHGVGHFLNVHEGPQSIRLNYVPTPLTPGMITSNEPGLYREGIHGIRCENLVLTVDAMTTDFGRFLRFETLTLCPFELSLFDTALMTPAEIEWLNEYHARVREALAPGLDGEALRWLEKNTRPLTL
ncbi:MAG: aminopeptidase P family protein [Bacteroides sp.]|nr:aminopeptidase P family protein [Bacteroides sp.]